VEGSANFVWFRVSEESNVIQVPRLTLRFEPGSFWAVTEN
jgi:hypothetical protein